MRRDDHHNQKDTRTAGPRNSISVHARLTLKSMGGLRSCSWLSVGGNKIPIPTKLTRDKNHTHTKRARDKNPIHTKRARGENSTYTKLAKGKLLGACSWLSLVWYNTKLLATYSWLLAAALLASLLFFLEPMLMDAKAVGRTGEYLVALMGLLLFPHLSLMEEGGIGEALLVKRIPQSFIFTLRWLITIGYALVLIVFFLLVLHNNGATFAVFPMIAGSGLTLLALGTFGMLISQLASQAAAGYILGFAWYLIDLMTKGKLTGSFYLFGMVSGEWRQQKLWLAALAAVCVTLSVMLTRHKRMG